MENIIIPKYSEGDIIRLNSKKLGEVYSTYHQFFKLYNFNDENYSTDNLIEDYRNVDFMIEHIAPHHREDIPLYVIVTELCKVRFLVNEQAIKEKVSHNPLYGDNQKYTTIYNITKNYYKLKEEAQELKVEVQQLKNQIMRKPMPELKAGIFGKVYDNIEENYQYFVITIGDKGLIMVYEDGEYDDVGDFDGNGKAYFSDDSVAASIVTLYSPNIKSFRLAKRADGTVNSEKNILWKA